MDYQRIYTQFIDDRKGREPALLASGKYKEVHHILPRSLGGTDEPENLVALTAEDHLRAHLLLAKIHGGLMWGAIWSCLGQHASRGKIPTKQQISAAALARRNWALLLSGEGNPFFGKQHSAKTLAKMRDQTIHVIHHKDGRVLSGTQFEIREKTGLSPCKVSAIVLGSRKSAAGWFCPAVGGKIADAKEYVYDYWRSKQKLVTLYHCDGATWTGYPVDFKHNYSEFRVNTSVRGWYKTREGALAHYDNLQKKCAANSAKRGSISGKRNPMAGTRRRAVWFFHLKHKDGREYRGLSTDLADSQNVEGLWSYQHMCKVLTGRRKANGKTVKSWHGWSALSFKRLAHNEYSYAKGP